MTVASHRIAVNAAAHPGIEARRWIGPSMLLGTTAVLYLWGLAASGWANAYYSAAAQAGAHSLSAWLFGATDAAGGITVDKTPASVWVMALSVRLFGLSPWSVLAPQALAGVGSVWLLYAAVRRWHGEAAGLLAGAVLALTPVAALIFRFNNPDALLTVLLVAGAYATLRAIEAGSVRWLMAAGALVGFGFLTKMLQAFLVLPAFVLAYLVAAPGPVRTRLAHVGVAAAALLVAGGWWVLLVELTPATSRPYVGGSQTDSVLELALGYNGFGRLTGDEVGSVGGGAGWGEPGLTRLFGGEMGSEIAWLLPAALIALGWALWVTRVAPRTDRTRAALLLWGGWLLVTGVVFSFMSGIVHAYYTVMLAPPIAALVGIGAALAWRLNYRASAVGVLAAAVAVTAAEASLLLGREDGWLPWLRPVVVLAGFACAGLLVLVPLLRPGAARAVAALAVLAALAAPAAYSAATAATPHSGAIPTVGPAGLVGFGSAVPQGRTARSIGNLLQAPSPSADAVELLRQDADRYTWAAAAVGSNNAAGYQLASGLPVLAVGGFNGTDPAPTLEQFQDLVAGQRIHWFVAGTLLAGETGSDASARIAAWVAGNFEATSAGGVTLYDLTGRPT